jgi:hypothetical protein
MEAKLKRLVLSEEEKAERARKRALAERRAAESVPWEERVRLFGVHPAWHEFHAKMKPEYTANWRGFNAARSDDVPPGAYGYWALVRPGGFYVVARGEIENNYTRGNGKAYASVHELLEDFTLEECGAWDITKLEQITAKVAKPMRVIVQENMEYLPKAQWFDVTELLPDRRDMKRRPTQNTCRTVRDSEIAALWERAQAG